MLRLSPGPLSPRPTPSSSSCFHSEVVSIRSSQNSQSHLCTVKRGSSQPPAGTPQWFPVFLRMVAPTHNLAPACLSGALWHILLPLPECSLCQQTPHPSGVTLTITSSSNLSWPLLLGKSPHPRLLQPYVPTPCILSCRSCHSTVMCGF